MKLRNKIIELLGGVTQEKHALMETMWQCESTRTKGLLRKFGNSIDVVSSVTVYPNMVGAMSEDALKEYVESELACGILSEVKKHMVVEERREITGVVTYRGTIMVFERNDEG